MRTMDIKDNPIMPAFNPSLQEERKKKLGAMYLITTSLQTPRKPYVDG